MTDDNMWRSWYEKSTEAIDVRAHALVHDEVLGGVLDEGVLRYSSQTARSGPGLARAVVLLV